MRPDPTNAMLKAQSALDMAKAFVAEAIHSDHRFQSEVADEIQEAILALEVALDQ